jgi:hypothetical protein
VIDLGVAAFEAAIERDLAAGFRVIEARAAHGYLPAERRLRPSCGSSARGPRPALSRATPSRNLSRPSASSSDGTTSGG